MPADADILQPDIRKVYRVGDTIGPGPILVLNDNELVAGRNNSHPDVRLSVLGITENGQGSVVRYSRSRGTRRVRGDRDLSDPAPH